MTEKERDDLLKCIAERQEQLAARIELHHALLCMALRGVPGVVMSAPPTEYKQA